MDRETFDREARRLTIDGDHEAWLIHVDGEDGEWQADRSTDEADLTELIFEILRIPKTAEGRRAKKAR